MVQLNDVFPNADCHHHHLAIGDGSQEQKGRFRGLWFCTSIRYISQHFAGGQFAVAGTDPHVKVLIFHSIHYMSVYIIMLDSDLAGQSETHKFTAGPHFTISFCLTASGVNIIRFSKIKEVRK